MIETFAAGIVASGIYRLAQRRSQGGRSDGLRRSTWKLPPLDLLDAPSDRSQSDLGGNGGKLVSALAARGVKVKLADTVDGPTTVRYELAIGATRVARLRALREDIALALGTPDVSILSPVNGRSVVGVEVARSGRETVRLRSLFDERPPLLRIPVGLTTDGERITADLTDSVAPHLLVAGATGAGKSTMINAAIVSLVMGASPNDLRLLLIDPKETELTPFEKLPHLWVPVVTETRKAVQSLETVVQLIAQRKAQLRKLGVRNIKEARAKGEEMPYLVVIVDELANLMTQAKNEVEPQLATITAIGRALGVHVVLATQRPSVDVITGVIKGNVNARAAFAVASNTDSRVILDSPGAERLRGMGDMFWRAGGKTLTRVQSPLVTDDEIERIVQWWMRQR